MTTRNLPGWLPNVGPFTVQADGVELPRRGTINFVGGGAEDDPDNDRTNIETGGEGGDVSVTGTGFLHATSGSLDGAAKLVENADVHASAAIAVTKLAAGAANTVLKGGASNAFAKVVNADVDAAAAIAASKVVQATGTGFPHVTSGVLDAASKLVENADVHASAAIALSKTALSANAQSWLADPTSAKLRTLVSDETGTGALFFAGGDFGAATGTSLALTGALSFGAIPDGNWLNQTGRVAISFLSGSMTVGADSSSSTNSPYDETRIAGTLVTFPDGATSTLPVASGATGAALSNFAGGQTTDATVTSLFTWTIADEAATLVTAEIVALLDSGAETGAWVRRARIKRDGGTVTVGTVEDSYTSEETPAWDVTIDNSGSTGRIRVTGEVGHDIQWGGVITRLYTHNF